MVYVDDMDRPYRGMKMSHMIADSHSELIEMANKIGLNTKWIQHKGTAKEHFDICKKYKEMAIKLGAVQITIREMSKKRSQRNYQEYDF